MTNHGFYLSASASRRAGETTPVGSTLGSPEATYERLRRAGYTPVEREAIAARLGLAPEAATPPNKIAGVGLSRIEAEAVRDRAARINGEHPKGGAA